jgi:hypothetical protein
MKLFGYGLVGFLSVALALGCTVTASPGGVVDTEYEGCVVGDACTGGTTCQATEFTASFAGNMCTASCLAVGPVLHRLQQHPRDVQGQHRVWLDRRFLRLLAVTAPETARPKRRRIGLRGRAVIGRLPHPGASQRIP